MTATKMTRLDHQLEFAKWTALLAMVFDHIGFMFHDLVDYHSFRAIGRITWPLLVWVTAVRLMQKPERAAGYLKRLIPWAIISQPIYWLCFYPNWPETGEHRAITEAPLNIFATLALGVMLFMLWQRWQGARSFVARGLVALGALLVLGVSAYPVGGLSYAVDYGPIAVLAIPAVAIMAQRSLEKAALLSGLLAVLANTYAINTLSDPVMTMVVLTLPFFGGLLGVLFLTGERVLPRLPRWSFYLFYPAHIVGLILTRALLFPVNPTH
jgi:hypothetical protein